MLSARAVTRTAGAAAAWRPAALRQSPLALRPATPISIFSNQFQCRAKSTVQANPSSASTKPRSAAAATSSSSPTSSLANATHKGGEHYGSAASMPKVARETELKKGSITPLDWESFFKLRRKRRRLQLTFSFIGLLGGFGVGAVLIDAGVAESVVESLPLDPFLTLGLVVVSAGALGWLIGPSMGTTLFYAMNNRLKTQIISKENSLLARIHKHRVNPSGVSAANPAPDFYGEKINSVAGYRQWLKDQKAFIRKRSRSII